METNAATMSEDFWNELARDCARWATSNYPGSIGKPHHPKIGITEELGELAEAIEEKNRDKALDALADVAIYALDFIWKISQECSLDARVGTMTAHAVFRDALDSNQNRDVDVEQESSVFLRLMKLNGKLAHHWLKRDQGIRINEDHFGGMRTALVGILSLCWDVHDDVRDDDTRTYPETIHRVWQRLVSKRNWIKNPTDGVDRSAR